MKNLLEIRDLSIRFRSPDRVVDAVKGVSLSMQAGGSLAIVGESGSGKSVTALALTRLLPVPPAEVVSGDILFEGESVMRMSAPRLRELRGGGIRITLSPSNRTASTARMSKTWTPKSSGGWTRWGLPTPPDACATIRTSSAAACSSGS